MRLQEVESQELPGRGNGHCFGIALAPPALSLVAGAGRNHQASETARG